MAMLLLYALSRALSVYRGRPPPFSPDLPNQRAQYQRMSWDSAPLSAAQAVEALRGGQI